MHLIKSEYFEKHTVIDEEASESNILPRDRMINMSPDDFEEFICEWLTFKKIYNEGVYRIGQSGDKGRDVIAYESGKVDYYQCKCYKDKLMPSDFWIEFGKLVYFTFIEEIPKPRSYKIVAPKGGGPSFIDLIKKPDKLQKELIRNWDSKCSKYIIRTKIDLTDELEEYIKTFDFSIVELVDMSSLLLDYAETPLFYFRFGGTKKPVRRKNMTFTSKIEEYEINYVNELLDVYTEKLGFPVTKDNIKKHIKINEDFNENRSYFFSAESLNRNLRDVLSSNEEFDNLKNEIYSGVSNFAKREFKLSEEKMNEILHEATRTDLSSCVSYRYLHFVKNDDKKGICHHLVNEGRITWFGN